MNKKGFTLIELLAVIVLLGIVLVITVPTVIGNIRNNKISGLHTLSKEYAKWYDRINIEDKLTDGQKIAAIPDSDWHCIKDIDNNNLYGLDSSNVVLNGTASMMIDETTGKITNIDNIDKMCSAIRIINNDTEVLLFASDNGDFDSNGTIRTYALSSAGQGYDK